MTQTMLDTFLVELVPQNNLFRWHVSFTMQEGVFSGERFTLEYKIPSEYPIVAPEVVFVGAHPLHEHVYSNGFICLAILYDDWSPSYRISSIAFAIITLLSSARSKGRPSNDAELVRFAIGKRPKQITWTYD